MERDVGMGHSPHPPEYVPFQPQNEERQKEPGEEGILQKLGRFIDGALSKLNPTDRVEP